MGTGYPGYTGIIPKSTALVSQTLRDNGYATGMFGKWHNTPEPDISPAGPFDRWPTGLGFDYFYGFNQGETHQYYPVIYRNTTWVPQPKTPEQGYHFTADMTDEAISWTRNVRAAERDKPWFMYYSAAGVHAPHHASKELIAKYKGKFDHGWDKQRELTHARQLEMGVIPKGTKLTPRHKEIPSWDSRSADEKQVYTRLMETFAAYMDHTDPEVGRLIDSLAASGELDNTLVMYVVGDNGASAEGGLEGTFSEIASLIGIQLGLASTIKRLDEIGGPHSEPHVPVGWAWAMNAPFQWTKQVASHFGGTRNPMVVHWPKGIKAKGETRNQFHHVIDVVPTVLEAANIPAPVKVNGVDQKPIEGTSMVYSFDDAKAEGRRRTQYFEIFGRRSVYHDGWVAGTTPKTAPWLPSQPSKNANTDYNWELYNVEEDFSQATNLAAKFLEKLQAMKDRFLVEATKYNVLPLDDSNIERFDVSNRPSLVQGRKTFTYRAGMTRIPEGNAPDLKNRSWQITADLTVPETGADGMIFTQGGRFNGIGLYVLEGKPVFLYNFLNMDRTRVAAKDALKPGKHTVVVKFDFLGDKQPGGPAVATLLVDGKEAAKVRIEKTIPLRISLDETMDIGEDAGTPVSEEYKVPFKFKGTLGKVVIDLK